MFGSNIAENMKKEIAKNKFKPRNIVSFHCDSTGISDIKMVKLIGKKDKGEMREQLTQKSKQIFKLLLSTRKRVFKDAVSIDGDYYLSL